MTKTNKKQPQTHSEVGGSFRDPAGFVYKNSAGEVLRQVNKAGAEDFDLLISSGLYKKLVDKGLLVRHKNIGIEHAYRNRDVHAVIKPQQIRFISYQFEWSFGQLKDAALLTLRIQKLALKYGMSLKDASAYNVQFEAGKAVFIDTLSFEKREPGQPWQAYRQFCQHFLAPLALMSYVETDLLQLLRIHLDGIPLELASSLLPRRAKLKAGIMMHIVLHARAQKAKESETKKPQARMSEQGLIGILDSLTRTTASLKPRTKESQWGDYYEFTNYSKRAADTKAKLITNLTAKRSIKTAIDLGGNNGRYSRALNKAGIFTICTDIDPNAVEANYQRVVSVHEELMLPLKVDLTNPGGSLGWAHEEREPLNTRIQCDLVLALALIHHLAIANNVPLEKVAKYFASFGPWLVLEFVPKQDSQVQKLLATRKDIFDKYNEEGLEKAFSKYYSLVKSERISGSHRTLYLYKRKG